MNTRHFKLFGCLLAVTNVALADASYQETTQITGGQLVDTLKSMPFAPKQVKKMFDPVNSLKMLHGNQLASVSKSTTEITHPSCPISRTSPCRRVTIAE